MSLLIHAYPRMLRIIIADDHAGVREGIKQLLLEEFPAIYLEEAEDAAGLIEKALNDSWDLVISDLVMPGGSGLEALKAIKKVKSQLPIIIISTYPADQYKNRVLQAGAYDFISKDTFPSHLVNAVRKVFTHVND